jgi:hypothetical protein
MGRISSLLLLLVALLEVLEVLVGGRLSLPEEPETRQSQDTQPKGRGKWRMALLDSLDRSVLKTLFTLAEERSTVLNMGQKCQNSKGFMF